LRACRDELDDVVFAWRRSISDDVDSTAAMSMNPSPR
jgi:hypothetical protein